MAILYEILPNHIKFVWGGIISPTLPPRPQRLERFFNHSDPTGFDIKNNF